MGSSLSARFWIETETFYFIFQTGKKEATPDLASLHFTPREDYSDRNI